MGLRYSNEFYFVTPAGLLDVSEIPVECGLIEIGVRKSDQVNLATITQAVTPFTSVDAVHGLYSIVSMPAPWRETPGPTWQLVAAMLRNQRRSFCKISRKSRARCGNETGLRSMSILASSQKKTGKPGCRIDTSEVLSAKKGRFTNPSDGPSGRRRDCQTRLRTMATPRMP
jgi:hypothetical protein